MCFEIVKFPRFKFDEETPEMKIRNWEERALVRCLVDITAAAEEATLEGYNGQPANPRNRRAAHAHAHPTKILPIFQRP
jgi:hypothetical protein